MLAPGADRRRRLPRLRSRPIVSPPHALLACTQVVVYMQEEVVSAIPWGPLCSSCQPSHPELTSRNTPCSGWASTAAVRRSSSPLCRFLFLMLLHRSKPQEARTITRTRGRMTARVSFTVAGGTDERDMPGCSKARVVPRDQTELLAIGFSRERSSAVPTKPTSSPMSVSGQRGWIPRDAHDAGARNGQLYEKEAL